MGFYGFIYPEDFISAAITPENRVIVYLVYGFVLWLPAVAVILKYGKTLKTKAALNARIFT